MCDLGQFIADTTNCRVREVSGGTITMVRARSTDVAVDSASAGVFYVITGALAGECQLIGVNMAGPTSIFTGPTVIDGPCTTIAGNHVAVSSTGSIYASFADSMPCEARAVVANNSAVTVAGTATCGYSGDGGPATAAELSSPGGLAVDGAGNLYISDSANNVVRIVYSPVLASHSSVGGIAESPHLSQPGVHSAASSRRQTTPFFVGGLVALVLVLFAIGAWRVRMRQRSE